MSDKVTDVFPELASLTRGVTGSVAVTIVLVGEVDLVNGDDLAALLANGLAAEPDRLVVDIAGLGFIDAHGIGLIASTAEVMERRGGVVKVTGAGPFHQRVFEIVGLADLLA